MKLLESIQYCSELYIYISVYSTKISYHEFFLQVLTQQGYDAACDIWSLGVLFYTMLAG